MTVEIIFKDGTRRTWRKESRPGGSYDNSVEYRGEFIVVKDVWDKRCAFSADSVKEVITTPEAHW